MPSHAKLDPQPAWARFEEVIIRLDSGEIVAVTSENTADLTGGTAIIATARVVDAAGTPVLDAAGLPIATNLRHPYRVSDLADGMRALDLQRDCVRVVLGEPTRRLFRDAAGKALREKLSIRNKLATAACAEPTGALAHAEGAPAA